MARSCAADGLASILYLKCIKISNQADSSLLMIIKQHRRMKPSRSHGAPLSKVVLPSSIDYLTKYKKTLLHQQLRHFVVNLNFWG